MQQVKTSTPVRWTPTTIDCYLRGYNCQGCTMHGYMESGPCRCKYSAQELVRLIGVPQIINARFDSTEVKEDFMIATRTYRSTGFLLDFISEGAQLKEVKVYKNKNGHPQQNRCCIITTIKELKERYGLGSLIRMYNMLYPNPEELKDCSFDMNDSTEVVASALWDLFETVAIVDKENRKIKRSRDCSPMPIVRDRKKDKNAEEYRLKSKDASRVKTPQAVALAQIIIDLGKDAFTYSEIIAHVEANKTPLKTIQPGKRIFDYYRDKLRGAGILEY